LRTRLSRNNDSDAVAGAGIQNGEGHDDLLRL
jgi:hypothetical protein